MEQSREAELSDGQLHQYGRIDGDVRERIYGLWDELSDFDTPDADDALQHLLRRLCRWIDAENAFRIGAILMFDPSHIDARRQKKGLKGLNSSDGRGATNRALAAGSGRFRLFTLQSGDLVDLAQFTKTSHYDWHYRQLGISDRMWVMLPVNAGAEAYYCFDKHGKRRRFTPRDMAVAAHALRSIKCFHRQSLLSHGLGISNAALTPTERRALQTLPSGRTEKQIAKAVGVTRGSAHQYVTSVYRKFGAQGRAKMMTMWLSRSI